MQITLPVQQDSVTSPTSVSSPSTLADYLLRPDTLIRVVLYLTFLAYFPTVLFGFVYDDVELVVLNPWMASWNGIASFFTHPFWGFLDFPRATDYYRPLVMTLFSIVRQLAGPAPAWFHLAAIGVHLAAVYLVYRLACELAGDGTLAAIAAAIFGLHPTKIESVAWISGVSDSLCVVFILACMVAYLRWKKAGARGLVSWAALLWLLLAMLSKEVAVLVPILVAFYEVLSGERRFRDRVKSVVRVTGPYVAVVAAALMARAYVMRDLKAPAGDHLESLYSAPRALIWYLGKQLWPLPVSIQYPTLLINQPSFLQFVVPLAALLVSVIALACLLRHSAAALFLTGWFALTLAPVLVFGAVLQLHDRHMYAPSVATSIAIAYLIVTFVRRSTRSGFPLQATVVVLLCVVLAGMTVREARYWADDISLFSRAVLVAPDRADAYGPLALAYFTERDFNNAERVSRLWIDNAVDPSGGWSFLAEIRRQQKDYAGARKALLMALGCAKKSTERAIAELQLGRVAQDDGDSVEAAHWFAVATAEQPNNATLHDFYGRALLQTGKTAQGEQEIRTALLLRQQKGY